MRQLLLAMGAAIALTGCVTSVSEPPTKIVVREVRPEQGTKVIDMTMEVRYFPVADSFLERPTTAASCDLKDARPGGFDASKTSEAVAEESATDRELKKFFAQFDVLWPEGSSLCYLRGIAKLRVRNTTENLDLIEKALEELNQGDALIEVSTTCLEVEQKVLDEVGRALLPGRDPAARCDLVDFASVPVATLERRLAAHRGVSILLSASAVMRNGENAVVKDVSECIYPQDYDVQLSVPDGEKKEKFCGVAMVEPQNFTMREVGTILDVMPTLTSDNVFVDLALRVSHVGQPTWREFGMELPTPNCGGKYGLPMQQPTFPTSSVDSHVRVAPGEVALVGVTHHAAADGQPERFRLMFVRTRLIDAHGDTFRAQPLSER